MDCSETRWRVAGHLAIGDVARLLAVDAATKRCFDVAGSINVWRDCAEYEFEDLYAPATLFEGPDRSKFLRFLALLGRANYALCSPMFITSIEGTFLIDHRLRKAADACSAFTAASGRAAHVLLGEFELDDSQRSTMFSFGETGKPPIAGLPGGVLQLKLVLDGNVLWSWAEYGVGDDLDDLAPCVQAHSVQLSLSVDSAVSDIFMSYRGVPLVLDGRWRSTMVGICSGRTSRRGRGGRRRELTMCVLCLFDGAPSDDDNSLMNAMSLDAAHRST